MKIKPKKAWIIQWLWIGEHAKVEPKILHILDPRKGAVSVIEYMKNFYLNSGAFAINGRFEYIYNQKHWESLLIKDGDKISLGKNPHLLAYKTDNLIFEYNFETMIERAKWTIPPTRKLDLDTLEVKELSEPVDTEFIIDYNKLGIHS